MKTGFKILKSRLRPERRLRAFVRFRVLAPALILVAVSCSAGSENTNSTEETVPITPRELFNAGARKLREGKLGEAETFLQNALASQNDRIQPPALYNLGLVRFAQGSNELKRAPAPGPAIKRGWEAMQTSDAALRAADEALASNDPQQILAAYLRGRGARRELRAATEAVARALNLHGATLAKWQRASADFKSAAEMDLSDTNALHNADCVDRYIARLVDSLPELQQSVGAIGNQDNKMGNKLRQLKGQIPDTLMPEGIEGGEDDGGDLLYNLGQEQVEAQGMEGQETAMSPEQAEWLLDGLKLGGERRLSFNQETNAPPKDRLRQNW